MAGRLVPCCSLLLEIRLRAARAVEGGVDDCGDGETDREADESPERGKHEGCRCLAATEERANIERVREERADLPEREQADTEPADNCHNGDREEQIEWP